MIANLLSALRGSRRSSALSRRSGRKHRPLKVESLEDRMVLAVMTAHEQLLVELINRARSDPQAEVNRYSEINDLNDGLSPNAISSAPKQPLAPHQALIDAAGAHSEDMLNFDYFSHTSRNGDSPSDRARDAGYPSGVGENIAWGGTTGTVDQIAHVYARHKALFLSPGHRLNLMGTSYREIGAGVRYGVFTTTRDWNASMVTEMFGSRGGNRFITGVAYTDQVVSDNFYTVGEGVGSVTITAVNASDGSVYTTTTGQSGGYGLQVPDGTYTVTALGGSINGEVRMTGVTVSGQNTKLDVITTNATGPITTNGMVVAGLRNGRWWQSESTGTVLATSEWTTWPANTGWMDVQTADVNGDGIDEVIGRRSNGQWWVTRKTGGNTVNELWGNWSSAIIWRDVSVGDFDGDGDDDIAGRTSGGVWWVSRSMGDHFQNEKWGLWSNRIPWYDVNAGDFDGDGDDDIAGRASNGAWWIARSDGTSLNNERWGAWSSRMQWRNVMVGDFNGDGLDDIVGRSGNNWWAAESLGNSFTNRLRGAWSSRVTWSNVNVADVNGDGRDDVVGRAGGNWWVALSTGPSFQNDLWAQWSATANWTDVMIGDLDADGRDDIIARVNRNWFVGRSNGTSFETRNWGRWPTATGWDSVLVGNLG